MKKARRAKAIALVAVLIMAAIALCGCEATMTGNRVVGGKDVQTFTYAYICLGGQKFTEGYITQWRDYTDSDVVQVMIDGKFYLTHYANVIMVADPEHGSLNYSDPDWFTNE